MEDDEGDEVSTDDTLISIMDPSDTFGGEPLSPLQ